MSSFQKRLREAMDDRGMNQAELARETGLWPSAISDYLKGKYEAKQDKVDILAKTLGVSPVWLMGLAEEEQPPPPSPTIPETIAAHLDGAELSEDDVKDIADFIDFVKQRKKKD